MAQTSNFVSSLAIAIPRKFFPPTRTLRPPRYLAPPHSNVFLPTRIMFVPLDISHSPLELSPPPVRFFPSPSRYRFPSTVLEFFWPEVQYFILLCSAVHYTELFLLPSRSRPPSPKPNPFSPIRFLSLSEFGFPLTRIFPQTRSIFVSFDILPSLLKLLSL